MKILYQYKDQQFEDIRDIIENNKLEPDYDYILNEYLPFQLFMTGRTFFKDVFIKVDTGNEFMAYDGLTHDYFARAIRKYFVEHNFEAHGYGELAMALSGGIDSSTLAFHLKPPIVFSGYYDAKDFDETKYSSAVAEKIGTEHIKVLLGESDFINYVNETMQAIGTPIAGMGSVMEYFLAKLMKKKYPDLKTIIYGNGGDEVFLGYWTNHYAMKLAKLAETQSEYISNFYPSQKASGLKLIDYFLISSLDRSPDKNFLDSNAAINCLKILETMNIGLPMAKIMYVNTRIILPSLLHLVNQICRANNLKAFNPLANNDFVYYATKINNPYNEVPKKILRDKFLPRTPENPSGVDKTIYELKNNFIKKGFPIPYHDWTYLDSIMEITCNLFNHRMKNHGFKFEYNGINRWTWGIFQAEAWFRTFIDEKVDMPF